MQAARSLDFAAPICNLPHVAARLRAPVMDYNVELMRDLIMVLEDLQASPRATIIVSVDEVSDEIGWSPDAVDAGMTTLLSLGYIDGPGADEPGFWFFRKLTRKGTKFADATRSPEDWDRMKRHFAGARARMTGPA